MDPELLTPANITFGIGVLGVIFTIYNYFKNPQITMEQKDALFDQSIKYLSESTDRRFKEIQDSFQSLLVANNNHIHTIDVKVDKAIENMRRMGNEITRLATIIEERMPKK